MTAIEQDIVAVNAFERQANGVYAQLGVVTDFNYSDGEDTEQALAKILRNARDRSSQSSELEAQITDWPTEYHLSSTRANLLRPLDLSGCSRVLELGCGCGSISRYLAEQSHLTVDAVEGSPVRAALAAERCKDLPNIRILTANFNQLRIPAQSYDLILFVGVLEYAGRFADDKSDQQAVLDLLKLAKQALRPSGVVLIAIENRTGLKYAMGAKEDHYAVPFVGLDDYPDAAGIRTYDHAQWHALRKQSPFLALKTLLPFPDYKIPHLLIDGDAMTAEDVQSRRAVHEALRTTASRDYCSPDNPFPLGRYEARLWQGVVEANALTQLSNSFLLLLADSDSDIQRLAPRQAVTVLDNPEFNYVKASLVPPPHARINELTQQLDAFKVHAHELEKRAAIQQDRLDQIEVSLPWRLAQRLRSLLR